MRLAYFVAAVLCGAVAANATPGSADTTPAQGAPPATAPASPSAEPAKVIQFFKKGCMPNVTTPNPCEVLALGDDLIVTLDGSSPLLAKDWTLDLDGQPVLDPAEMPTIQADTADGKHQLIFRLHRSDTTRTAWTNILGSPTPTRDVTVGIVRLDDKRKPIGNPIVADDKLTLNILKTWWLALAVVVAAGMTVAIVGAAWKTAIIRDNLLTQIPVKERPFSLGRFQMAFWFAMVLTSFFFLWALLWDYNTVTPQALTLMGIGAATAAGALGANQVNDDDLDAAKKALVDAGFVSSKDIEKVRTDLANAKAQVQAATNESNSDALTSANADVRNLTSRVADFELGTQDYVSAAYVPRTGEFKPFGVVTDLINDKDGPALHRLQVLGWTLALGAVFLVGLYRNLAMPEFSTTLLALMGVSGASYVGFKFPEKT